MQSGAKIVVHTTRNDASNKHVEPKCIIDCRISTSANWNKIINKR